jgi:CheY-like chemotaxis protein
MNSQPVRRILIIDDSMDNQCLLRTLLEAKGYQVDCSSNGAEALTLLQSVGVLPDVILLDLQMPVMDGYGFLDSQRNTPELRDIPTVVMSADGDEEATRRKMQSPDEGRSPDVLTKPLSINSIVRAIERNFYLH